jgi:Asp-tRNA(Asn)/Glu-tRNA(Gln) amidotransferase A subunit family amidase
MARTRRRTAARRSWKPHSSPSRHRVPPPGKVPLSHTLDAVAFLGRSAACYAALDALFLTDADPPVAAAFELQTARDLIVLEQRRRSLQAGVRRRLEASTPSSAQPSHWSRRRSTLEDDEEYARVNLLMLRNPSVVNMLDRCAVSVPMHQEGQPPMGLMVAAPTGRDAEVPRIAAWIEEVL